MIDELSHITAELQYQESEVFNAATEYRALARAAAEKRVLYDCLWAQTLLTVKTEADAAGKKLTVAELEALCVARVSRALEACRIAEALAEGAKRFLEAQTAILTSLQTRAKLIQTEVSLQPKQI